MLSGRGRSMLNLAGNNNNMGLSLYGYDSTNFFIKQGNYFSQEYLDFKLKIIKNYIEPLMNKNYEYLKYNYHMIEETLENIKKYSNANNKDDIDLFTSILKIIRNSVDIHISYTETESKLYGTKGVSKLIVRTSRIVLEAKYEIYNNLFGVPKKSGDGILVYDDDLIDRIDNLLKTLNDPTFANIRSGLEDKVDLFLPLQKSELQKLKSS